MNNLRTKKKIATSEKPYSIQGSEVWTLPLDKKANGVKLGDIIAHLDDGIIYVYDKAMVWNSVGYIPRSKIQD